MPVHFDPEVAEAMRMVRAARALTSLGIAKRDLEAVLVDARRDPIDSMRPVPGFPRALSTVIAAAAMLAEQRDGTHRFMDVTDVLVATDLTGRGMGWWASPSIDPDERPRFTAADLALMVDGDGLVPMRDATRRLRTR